MKLPQLTLRELFLLVLVAAMGCGWWAERSALHRALEAEKWSKFREFQVELPKSQPDPANATWHETEWNP